MIAYGGNLWTTSSVMLSYYSLSGADYELSSPLDASSILSSMTSPASKGLTASSQRLPRLQNPNESRSYSEDSPQTTAEASTSQIRNFSPEGALVRTRKRMRPESEDDIMLPQARRLRRAFEAEFPGRTPPNLSPIKSIGQSSFIQTPPEDPKQNLLERLEDSGMDQLCVDYFIANYTITKANVSEDSGYLDYLEHLYEQAPAQSCLRLTITAVSYANMPIHQDCQWFQDAAQRRYTWAFHSIEEALKDDLEVQKDATLVAVILLSMLEINNTIQEDPYAWHNHVDQAVEIICRRGERQFLSLIGRKLFRTVYAHMLISALLTKKSPVLPFDIYEEHFEGDRSTELIRLAYETAEISAEWQSLAAESPKDSKNPRIISLLLKAKATVVELETWSEAFATECAVADDITDCISCWNNGVQNFSATEKTERQGPSEASQWSLFRACHILLQQAMFQGCQYLLSIEAEPEIQMEMEIAQVSSSPDSRKPSADTLLQDFRDLLQHCISAISEMTLSLAESIDHILQESRSMTGSSHVSQKLYRTFSGPGPAPARGFPIQKYAILVPLWAALSSVKMIIEADEDEGLPFPLTMTERETIRKRCRWLEVATEYIHADLGVLPKELDLAELDPGTNFDNPSRNRVIDWMSGFEDTEMVY